MEHDDQKREQELVEDNEVEDNKVENNEVEDKEGPVEVPHAIENVAIEENDQIALQ